MIMPHDLAPPQHSGAELSISRSLVVFQTWFLELVALGLCYLPLHGNMEPVSLTLAVIGTLDLCVTYTTLAVITRFTLPASFY